MSLLDRVFSPPVRAGVPGPTDDFWYRALGHLSHSGIRVTAENALLSSAVLACVRVLSEDISSLPLITYRRLDNGGKERALDLGLYRLLHDAPNGWMTAGDFWSLMTVFVELWGNGYAEIVSGPRGFAEQLLPLHPERVRVEQLDNGSLVYEVRPDRGARRILTADRVMHLRGLSLDGRLGMEVMTIAREVVGSALAMQTFAASLFRNSARPGGIIEMPEGVELNDESEKRLRHSFEAFYGGSFRAHSVAILEEGSKFHPIDFDAEKTQLKDSRVQQAKEIASIFRVPPHMIGILDNANFANVWEQKQDYVVNSLRSRARRYEQAISRDLILSPRVFAEFLMEGLLRAAPKDRAEFYSRAILNGWMSRNEVRAKENMNPLPGLDTPLMPLNMAPVGSDGAPVGGASGGENGGAPAVPGERAYRIALAAAERVVRKEIGALRRIAQRTADDPAAWKAGVDEFYDQHAPFVVEVLSLPRTLAETWCAMQGQEVRAEGMAAVEKWLAAAPAALAILAINPEGDGHGSDGDCGDEPVDRRAGQPAVDRA